MFPVSFSAFPNPLIISQSGANNVVLYTIRIKIYDNQRKRSGLLACHSH